MTKPRTKARLYRYDGKDEDGQHWGEYLTDAEEPTEKYFRMDEEPDAITTMQPTLAEAELLFGELLAMATPYNWMGSDLLDRTAHFLRRIDAAKKEDDK